MSGFTAHTCGTDSTDGCQGSSGTACMMTTSWPGSWTIVSSELNNASSSTPNSVLEKVLSVKCLLNAVSTIPLRMSCFPLLLKPVLLDNFSSALLLEAPAAQLRMYMLSTSPKPVLLHNLLSAQLLNRGWHAAAPHFGGGGGGKAPGLKHLPLAMCLR
eukprot:jgi/Botrbrau1/10418/Bobra.0133s0026.1